MEEKCFISFILFASFIALSAATCDLRSTDHNRCNYTIICIATPGSVSNPSCDDDPYVIFGIIGATNDYLTTGFFSATNFDSRVREIVATSNAWTHIDSSAFRYYTKTIILDITHNEISKIHNEAFRNLHYLQQLNISYNKLETLYPKAFLISDTRGSSVLELDLSNNKLIELSSELNELASLKKLHLQNNMLSKLGDDCFMSLKNLVYLNLQNNHLSSLNSTLTNLKNLKTLDLSYNNLIKLSGYEINRLVAMVDFNVSHNALTSVEANCFNQAFTLEKVDFSYNNIKINIENVMFINNVQLKYLDFYNNVVTSVQENSFKYCSLSYINLENNNFTGDIEENTFTGLRNISKLDLSRQNISNIRNKAFTDMDRLVHLNLSTNNIVDVDNTSFYNTSITELDLSYNKIRNLNFLQNCLVNLTDLHLNNNNITVVSKNAFDNQTQIRKLDLSMNRIKIIEQYSLPLLKLEYLNVTGNNLIGNVKNNVFSPAKYLRFLDLSNFNITKIDDSAFVGLTILGRLNLSNNQIDSINPNNFQGVGNMYSLDLSRNKLNSLTFNNSLLTNNLKALYLNNNKITNISSLFPNKCKLVYLDMSNNNISDVKEIGADIFPNLMVLNLANNKIKHLNNPKINSLTTLTDLGLSSNGISDINLSNFKEIISVDLSNNKLNYLNSSLIKYNEYLQALDVSRNNITDLPPGTFQYMKNLKLLNMSSNHLKKLRFGSLKGLHKTELMDLSKNDIEVLDVDVFHECGELKTLIIDYNHIKTFDVDRLIIMSLKKLKTLSLGGNPISCKEIVRNIKSANVTFFAIREVEVTSIDKIYHEDNVHGIKCGDDAFINESTTVKPETKKSVDDTGSSISTTAAVLTWCSVLTILLIAAAIFAYIKLFKKRVLIVNSNMTMQMSNSLESEFQNDLLS